MALCSLMRVCAPPQAESSAMIELLVSGKIISTALSITKVQETIWREFVLSNNSSSEAASSEVKSFSMEQFPPMVVTYRLTGLDGEATEDVVDKLGEEEATNAADLYANADYVTGPGLQVRRADRARISFTNAVHTPPRSLLFALPSSLSPL